MKFLTVLIILVILAGALFLLGTDMEVEDSGALPEVDITTEGGRLPDIDADTPEVTIESEPRTVEVPDVEVEMEETEIQVPEVDFNAAEDSVIDDASEPEYMERE